jgi:hypothetical protein
MVGIKNSSFERHEIISNPESSPGRIQEHILSITNSNCEIGNTISTPQTF